MHNDDTEPFKFRCLICGKAITAEVCIDHRICTIDQLPEEGHDDSDLLPLGAIEMTSYGHYGTAFFDPCDDGTQVSALICDDCMEERSDRLMYIDKQRRLSPFDKTMDELNEQAAQRRAEHEARAARTPAEDIPLDKNGYPDPAYVQSLIDRIEQYRKEKSQGFHDISHE